MEILKLVCASLMLLASVQGVPDYRDSSEELGLDEDIGSNDNDANLDKVEGDSNGDEFLDLVAWSINWYEALKGHLTVMEGFESLKKRNASLENNQTDRDTPFGRDKKLQRTVQQRTLNYPYLQLQPEIYLPNKFTTDAVIQALKLTGKKIQVSHANVRLGLLFSIVTCDGIHCKIDEEYIRRTKRHLSYDFHVDKFPSHSAMVDAYVKVMRNVSMSGMMKNHGSWKSLSGECGKVYRSIMSVLEEEELVTRNTKGDLYTYSKKYLNIVLNLVKEDLEKSAVSTDIAKLTTTETDEEKVDDANSPASMRKAWFKVYHFPTELTWENIKLALKTTYLECMADGIIPKLDWKPSLFGTFNFLIPFMGDAPDIATLEETDDGEGGVKRLPSAMTQTMIDFIAYTQRYL